MVTFVFIKAEYVRDAQAYTRKSLLGEPDIYSEENDIGWSDVSGDILIGEYSDCSIADARERIKKVYPQANPEIFRFISVVSQGTVRT